MTNEGQPTFWEKSLRGRKKTKECFNFIQSSKGLYTKLAPNDSAVWYRYLEYPKSK